MRVVNFNSSLPYIVFILCMSVGVLLTSCSSVSEVGSEINNSEVNNEAIKNDSNKKTLTLNGKSSVAKDFQHIHPPNPCTVTLVHSHRYENDNHKHLYDCVNTKEFVSNAHIHPATKGARRYRHVHPNGANKHSHNRK